MAARQLQRIGLLGLFGQFDPACQPRQACFFVQTREFSDGGEGGELVFDWEQLPPGLDEEARLSRLTSWIELAEQAEQPYALKLPRRHFTTDRGPKQRAACLEALARFGEAPAP